MLSLPLPFALQKKISTMKHFIIEKPSKRQIVWFKWLAWKRTTRKGSTSGSLIVAETGDDTKNHMKRVTIVSNSSQIGTPSYRSSTESVVKVSCSTLLQEQKSNIFCVIKRVFTHSYHGWESFQENTSSGGLLRNEFPEINLNSFLNLPFSPSRALWSLGSVSLFSRETFSYSHALSKKILQISLLFRSETKFLSSTCFVSQRNEIKIFSQKLSFNRKCLFQYISITRCGWSTESRI